VSHKHLYNRVESYSPLPFTGDYEQCRYELDNTTIFIVIRLAPILYGRSELKSNLTVYEVSL